MRALGSAVFLVAFCIGVAPSLHASTTFVNFAGPSGTFNQGSDGNTMCFNAIGNTSCGGAYLVQGSAWSTTGSSTTALGNAALGQYNPYGLGDCNDAERASGGQCTTNPPEHAVGSTAVVTNGVTSYVNFDYVLLTFSQPVYSISVALAQFGDTDITYAVGRCSEAIAGSSVACSPTATTTLATLGSITNLSNVQLRSDNNGNAVDRTVNLDLSNTGSSGVNWLLIGASTTTNYAGNDFFKITSLTYSTTPEPATFGLAGAALLGLGLLKARKKRSAIV